MTGSRSFCDLANNWVPSEGVCKKRFSATTYEDAVKQCKNSESSLVLPSSLDQLSQALTLFSTNESFWIDLNDKVSLD